MPFELGIDYYGLRKSGIPNLTTKQFLILEAKKYDYMEAISDINNLYYDFIDFNKSYDEKLIEPGTDELAKNYIEHLSIAEYIREIRELL